MYYSMYNIQPIHTSAFIHNGLLCYTRVRQLRVLFFNSIVYAIFPAPIHAQHRKCTYLSTQTILFTGLIWISAFGEFTRIHKCVAVVVCCVKKSVFHVESHVINVIINGMLVYQLDVYFNSVWSLWLVKIQELPLLLLTLTMPFVLSVFIRPFKPSDFSI